MMPATQRQGRQPSHGPSHDIAARARSPTLRASTSRAWSRSMSRAPNAASPKNMTKMSSRPVREWTKWWPSKASSAAATVPRRSDRKSRRAIRPSMKIEIVPASATAKRQPKELRMPKGVSPQPMSHLPTGGCTTKSPSVP